ncbi:unnamed protein product [Linum trigynum]|uniref:Uncharacterized protein n=1 Tax=Linum trigynum TaxID=586398 RepID=A0AAV2E7Q9_9ROSI
MARIWGFKGRSGPPGWLEEERDGLELGLEDEGMNGARRWASGLGGGADRPEPRRGTEEVCSSWISTAEKKKENRGSVAAISPGTPIFLHKSRRRHPFSRRRAKLQKQLRVTGTGRR